MTKPYPLQNGGSLVVDQNGQIVRVDDDEFVLPDGHTLRVPMMLMDGGTSDMIPEMKRAPQTPTFDASKLPKVNVRDHRPGYATMTDAQRVQSDVAHHMMVKRTNDAWKKPAPIRDYGGLQHAARQMVAPQMHSQHSNSEKEFAKYMAEPDTTDPEAAWDRMRARQENAWKGAKTKTV
jgi:hypothetical protein